MTGFLAGAAVWRSTAQHLRLPNAVLYAEDAAELLPALFGCWAAGVHVILPGDALPGTLERLSAMHSMRLSCLRRQDANYCLQKARPHCSSP